MRVGRGMRIVRRFLFGVRFPDRVRGKARGRIGITYRRASRSPSTQTAHVLLSQLGGAGELSPKDRCVILDVLLV